MTKVLFITATHSRTGVPLAQIRLAKALQRRGYSVTYVIGFVPAGISAPVIDGVEVVNLDVDRAYKLALPIVSLIRRMRPDVIFTAEDHLNAVVSLAAILAGSRAKISASSRITPYRVYSNNVFSKKWVLKCFSFLLRRRVDALVCVSQDMVKEYEAIFGGSKYQCIYNVIHDRDTQARMQEPVEDPWMNDSSVPVVISAGSLNRRKGFADLIAAMKLVSDRMPARLVILGEGPRKAELQAQIDKEGLGEVVRLLGFQDNPLKYFSRSDVFVLSSYAEGLPNVLVEAMACGCTPVATDCPTGPREVLKDGEYGYLIPMRDPEAMAKAIQAAIENPMSELQLRAAIEPFAEDQVVRKHQLVLDF